MADTFKPLMKAIIAKLAANTAIMGYVGSGSSCRIYANVPQNTTFPFIQISITSAPFDTKDTTGMEHTVTIKVFSRKPTEEEAAALRSAIYGLLHRNESGLTLDNGTLFSLNYDGIGFVEKEPDGVTWQSLAQYRAMIMD